MSNKRVPQVRFAGFNEEREERKFLGIAQRITRIVSGSRQIVEYDDIESGYGTLNKDLSEKTTQKSGVEFGARDVLFGRLRPYLKNWLFPDFNGIAVGDFWVLRGSDCEPSFLYNLIQGTAFTAVSNISSGSKMPRSDWELVSQFRFMLPTSADEQRQIGSLFTGIDDLLSQHRKKLVKLRQTKASLQQKMFPQGDADEPELRLGGFSAAWVKVRFLDVIRSITDFRGRTPKKLGMDWSDHGYLALSANNVKNGYIDFTRDPHYGDESLYEKWMSGQELHKGQVLFTTEAPMGNVARVPDSRKYILSQRVIAFEVDQARVTEAFLAVLLGSPSTLCQLTALSSGGTAQGISQRSLAQVEVLIPRDLGEQAKISSTFEHLNSLILAQQRYLEKLKQIKASLLQKMFV